MKSKYILYALCLLLLYRSPASDPVQEGISNKVLRFHVLANSDSDNDQYIKRSVRDFILPDIQVLLEDVSNQTEAKAVLSQNLNDLETKTNDYLHKEGISYNAEFSISTCEFPDRQYGELLFPSGSYEALRIELGEAKGHNWWCVAYPSLCKTNESYDEITEDTLEEFKSVLTEEEYERLLSGKQTVFRKSALKKLVELLIDYFSPKE